MKKLICSTFREGYGIDQIRRTMTAGELINFLAQYDEDTPVYLSFDNGYTYGGIFLAVRQASAALPVPALPRSETGYPFAPRCGGSARHRGNTSVCTRLAGRPLAADRGRRS